MALPMKPNPFTRDSARAEADWRAHVEAHPAETYAAGRCTLAELEQRTELALTNPYQYARQFAILPPATLPNSVVTR